MCTSICVWKLPRVIYFGRHTYLFRLLKHSQYILVDLKTAMKKKKWFWVIPSSPSLMDGVRLNLKVWDIQSIFKLLLRQGFSTLAPMASGAGSPFPGRSSPKHCRLFSGLTSLCPLAASRLLSLDGNSPQSLQTMPIIGKLLPPTLVTVLSKTTVITCITNDIKKDLRVFLCTYVNEVHLQIEWFIYQCFNYQSLKIFNNS